MRPKKIPLRKCIASQEMLPKKSLVRFVRTSENQIQLDPTGKANGRGAYLGAEAQYFEMCKKKKALERALHVKISTEEYDQLEEEFMSYIQGKKE